MYCVSECSSSNLFYVLSLNVSLLNAPIGIYGGTFDPIHFGHLRPNLELCELFALAHVRFIPSSLPPHRSQPQTSVEQRVDMVAKAISTETKFVLDDREIKRGGTSYMVDTLRSLRQDYPKTPLCLLLGMDAFMGLEQWHHWQQLLTYAHIIVSQRPESDFNTQERWPKAIQVLYEEHKGDQDSIHQMLCGNIILQPVTQLSISSTDIRRRLKNKQSVRFLMPESVVNLIRCNDLYK